MNKSIKTLTRVTLMVLMGVAGVQALPLGGHGADGTLQPDDFVDAQGGHGGAPAVARPGPRPSGAGVALGMAGDGGDAAVEGGASGGAEDGWHPHRAGVGGLPCGANCGGVGAPALVSESRDLAFLAHLSPPGAGRAEGTEVNSFEGLQRFSGWSGLLLASAGEHEGAGALIYPVGPGQGLLHATNLFGGMAEAGGTGLPVAHGAGPSGSPLEMVASSGGAGGQVSPVPEPQTYALMLVGLAAVVFLRRRGRAGH